MSDNSQISWTDDTWNPTTGCTQIPGPHGAASGCDRCYAKALLDTRQRANSRSPRYGLPFEHLLQHEGRLLYPIRKREPRLIFVNSLSDLFHVDVERSFIDKVFAAIALSPQHTFQILTKRPERMRAYVDGWGGRYEDIEAAAVALARQVRIPDAIAMERFWTWANAGSPNLWCGGSVCSNADAARAATIRKIVTCAVRFLSIEPLLGPVDEVGFVGIDWLIFGGESGRGYRDYHPDWMKDAIARCLASKTPVWVKQDAGIKPGLQGRLPDDVWALKQFPREVPVHG